MASNDRIEPVHEVQLLRAAACDWRLSRGDVGVLAVILRHCDAELRAFPGPARIAKEARLTVTSVKGSIRNLEANRYLKVERPGPRKRNRFLILESPSVIPRAATRQLGFSSSRVTKGANSSRALTQFEGLSDPPTGQVQRPQTGQVRLHQLGKSTRQEVAFKTPKKSLPAALSSGDEEQERSPEQEQAFTERAREAYLQAKAGGHTQLMTTLERNHRERIADLIEDKAA